MNYGIKFCTTALVFAFFMTTLSAQSATNTKKPEPTAAYLAVQKDWQAFNNNLPTKTVSPAQEDSLAKAYNDLVDRLEAMTEQRPSTDPKIKPVTPVVPGASKERKFVEVQK
jgi:hypothetical protein